MSTTPSPLANAEHSPMSEVPRAMPTPRINSSIVTVPLRSQSPVHDGGVDVASAVWVGLAVVETVVGETVGGVVAVALGIGVPVVVGGAVPDALGLGLGVA